MEGPHLGTLINFKHATGFPYIKSCSLRLEETYCRISMTKQCVKVEFFELRLDLALEVALVKACTGPMILAYASSDNHAAANLGGRRRNL